MFKGWLTEDHTIVLMDDELDEVDTPDKYVYVTRELKHIQTWTTQPYKLTLCSIYIYIYIYIYSISIYYKQIIHV